MLFDEPSTNQFVWCTTGKVNIPTMTTKCPCVVLHSSITWTRVSGMCHRSNKHQHGLNNCCKHSRHNYKQPRGPLKTSALYLPRSPFFHYQCDSEVLFQGQRLKVQFSYLPVGVHTERITQTAKATGNRFGTHS